MQIRPIILGLLLASKLAAAPTVQDQVAQLEKKGQTEAAVQLVTTYLEAHPEQGAIRLLRARLLFKTQSMEEAETEATLAFGLTGGRDPEARKLLDEIRTSRPTPR
jgi:thioredoxin-like negative regulator of GroEL